MALTAQGAAQCRRCYQPCQYWLVCKAEANRRESKWADFCAYRGRDPAVWVNLTRDMWNGPASGCPPGYWEGLAPPDLASEESANADRNADGWAAFITPVAASLIQRDIPLATLRSRLEQAVADGVVPALLASKLERKVKNALGL